MTFYNWVLLIGTLSIVYFISTFSWIASDERRAEIRGKSKKREAVVYMLFVGALLVGIVFSVMCISVINIGLTCYLDDNRYGFVSEAGNTVSEYYDTVNVDMHDSLDERNQLKVNRGYWDKVESSVSKKEMKFSEFIASLVGSNRYLNYTWTNKTSYYKASGNSIIDSYKLSNYVYFDNKASYIILDKFVVYAEDGKDLELKDDEVYTIEYDKDSVVSIDGIDYYDKAIIKKGEVS